MINFILLVVMFEMFKDIYDFVSSFKVFCEKGVS